MQLLWLMHITLSRKNNLYEKKITVLDNGFVEYVSHMGSDLTVVNAARVSFNKTTAPIFDADGKEILSDKDFNLVKYLAQHNHWTPFAHPQITLRIKAPISIRTQFFKHKVGFCLSGDTNITFVKQNKKTKRSSGIRQTPIDELYQMWMKETPHSRYGDMYGWRKEISGYNIRVLNTDTSKFETGHIMDIICNGSKDVFLVTTKDGKTVKMTKDHRIYTKNGWESLEDAVGLVNKYGIYGMTKPAFVGINRKRYAGTGNYQKYEWMKEQRDLGYGVATIAANAGCSYHTIRKWLNIHNLKFDHLKNLQGIPWNKGLKGYTIHTLEGKLAQSKKLLNYYKKNPKQKQSTTWRQEVNRWTSQIAKLVHEKNGYTCQECACRGRKLNAHHIIPVLVDPTKAKDINNLISVCVECHYKIHSSQNSTKEFAEKILGQPVIITDWKKKVNKTGLRVHYSEIVKIEYVGKELVYDISVDHKSHNFIANGMVVHNCENEISRRYVTIDPEFYYPEWRTAPKEGAKQGSEDFMKEGTEKELCKQNYSRAMKKCLDVYEDLIKSGIAPEQARFVLPQGTYTEWWWTGSLAAYARFYTQRIDPHAQWEIREYAKGIDKILEELFPESWFCLTNKA